MSTHPHDFSAALDASKDASSTQRKAEQWLIDTSKELAAAEKAYRLALARRIMELHAEGVAWSSTADLARGDSTVAVLRYGRDVKAGVREAAQQAAWRAAADRKDANLFAGWSMRADLRDEQEPAATSVIGGRRAAA